MSTPPTAAWQLQSLLLDYPDERLGGHLDLVQRCAEDLPGVVGQPLCRFAEEVAGVPLTDLAARYVTTFDHRKRCSLFLTYYRHGDTRNRGVALLKLKSLYARHGLTLTPDELPDHLSVVLEFAAQAEPTVAQRLLAEHRAGIELLRMALTEDDAPWRLVLDSLCGTLPPLRGDEQSALARLIAKGPPEEQVGLAPFAPPEYMPQSDRALESTGGQR